VVSYGPFNVAIVTIIRMHLKFEVVRTPQFAVLTTSKHPCVPPAVDLAVAEGICLCCRFFAGFFFVGFFFCFRS